MYEAQGKRGRGSKKRFKGLTCRAGDAALGSHTEVNGCCAKIHEKPLKDFKHGSI